MNQMNRMNQTILTGACLLGCFLAQPILAQPVYHRQRIPEGYWSYYERSFKTRVVYQRYGNNMRGRMGNICFQAYIRPNHVSVDWWGRVPSSLRNSYSIADFTVDNVDFRPIELGYYRERLWDCE